MQPLNNDIDHNAVYVRARRLGLTQAKIGKELNRSIKSISLAMNGERRALLVRIDRLISRYERYAAEKGSAKGATA